MQGEKEKKSDPTAQKIVICVFGLCVFLSIEGNLSSEKNKSEKSRGVGEYIGISLPPPLRKPLEHRAATF